ncbi:hypothetical protein [Nocardia carnea]|uniref:hypothetical protein n=1 Tax=Nocardia carnea TaxID=37328 RepID=UPI002456BF59|nr:hypothetical protein [Nocardia carnea]
MINMFELAAGTRLELADGRTVAVVENMDDGMWISVQEGGADDSELVHAQDILRLIHD